MNREEVKAYIKKVGYRDVKMFKGDVRIDLMTLDELNTSDKFIHITRSTGTSMIVLDFSNRENETVLDKILKNKQITLDHWLEHGPITISYYNGDEIKKIKAEKAIDVFSSYKTNVIRNLNYERAEKTNNVGGNS